MNVYIGYIPKDLLLYSLWKHAKQSPSMKYCKKELIPDLTLEKTRIDINHMLHNDRDLILTTYYGKLLFIDITGNICDVLMYNLYNGRRSAENVIHKLKTDLLKNISMRYYKFY